MEFHVIDDDKYISATIVAMLAVHGFSSKAFNCPRQYIEHTQTDDFSSPIAVITDITMPGMSGYEMIDKLRKDIPKLKFVIISPSPEDEYPAMRGVGTFLLKPVKLETLGKIASSLAQHHNDKPSTEYQIA